MGIDDRDDEHAQVEEMMETIDNLHAKIESLESQLAAQAAAVEVLGACEQWINKDTLRRSVVFWGSCEREPAKFGAVLRIGDSAGPHVVNAAYGETLLEALAALVAAAGKETNESS